MQRRRWNEEILKRFMAIASGKPSNKKEVAISEDHNKKSKLFPKRKGKRGLWRIQNGEFVPQLYEFFPLRLGHTLLQAIKNINRLFQNLNLSPSNLMERLKEKDECYKM